MFYIVIRQEKPNDTPKISELVREAYLSNVTTAFSTAIFNETTIQLIVLVSAFLFILLQVPIVYCLFSIPIVLISMYASIYGSITMKSAQVMYEKKPEVCFVAEVYEPLFHSQSSTECYTIVTEKQAISECRKLDGKRKIIGTVSVMRHSEKDDWAWMFRLAVNSSYRRKGVGLKLVEAAKDWCREQRYSFVEAAMTECQENARHLFNKAGFEVKQLYHKKLFTSAYSLQMFQLRCQVLSKFD